MHRIVIPALQVLTVYSGYKAYTKCEGRVRGNFPLVMNEGYRNGKGLGLSAGEAAWHQGGSRTEIF